MPVLRCYVTEDDEKELLAESRRSGRQVEELAEAAISDACRRSRVSNKPLAELQRQARLTE